MLSWYVTIPVVALTWSLVMMWLAEWDALAVALTTALGVLAGTYFWVVPRLAWKDQREASEGEHRVAWSSQQISHEGPVGNSTHNAIRGIKQRWGWVFIEWPDGGVTSCPPAAFRSPAELADLVRTGTEHTSTLNGLVRWRWTFVAANLCWPLLISAIVLPTMQDRTNDVVVLAVVFALTIPALWAHKRLLRWYIVRREPDA